MEKLLLGIPELCEMTSLGRTKIIEEMDAGRLESVYVGRRRLVTQAALERYVASLPTSHEV